MILQRTAEGSEAILKNVQPGRYAKALFLGVWLCFWIAGEAFALWMLLGGLWMLLTGQPTDAGRDLIDPEAGVPVGLFLLVWLTLWTFGGIMAGREFLRSIFGHDRIRVAPEGLEVARSYGLFHTKRLLDRASLLSFRIGMKGGALCADTPRGTVELTSLGTYQERTDLAAELKLELGVSDEGLPDSAIPASLREAVSAEGENIIIKDPATRQKQAMVTWMIATPVLLTGLYLIAISFEKSDLAGLAVVCTVIAAGLTWGAVWLSFGRSEWALHSGRVVVQRRFGAGRKVLYESTALELSEDRAGKNGTAFFLKAVVAGTAAGASETWKNRKTLFSDSSDPSEPRMLGIWLSRKCGIPFDDQTTAESRAKQMEELQSRLAGSGVVGEAVLKLITRFGPESQQRNSDQSNND